MHYTTTMVIYLMAYIITILYFVVMGCVMLCYRCNNIVTHGEQEAKLRMTRTMGVTMMVFALQWIIYLPPMLLGFPTDHLVYRVLFLVVLMMGTPLVYALMFAVVQRKADTLRWSCSLAMPFLLLAAWQIIAPPNQNDYLPVYIGAALSVTSYLYLVIKFASEYRIYLRRLQSEYSDTTSREMTWSWICFSALAVQGIVFVSYQLYWTPLLEIIYLAFSIVNAGYLCFSIYHQRTIDIDVVEEGDDHNDNPTPNLTATPSGTPNANATSNATLNQNFIHIEQKLKTLFEDKFLFLDPDITLETLALRIGSNRTYMGVYFRQRNLTFYQYINTLRIEYAIKLMQDNPHESFRKIAEQSGFRSQPTFRKAFQEVMGCLPSEVREKSPSRPQQTQTQQTHPLPLP